ncbi:MAG: hypothetical protein ACREL3_05800 [Gemmatimonadales bacterium]
MAERFLCSDPQAGDLSFADVESVLDALEAALVSADTPLFDGARQSWQPVGLHPEVRAAWEARARYRPPGGSALALPALPAPLPALDEDAEMAVRRAAYSRMRGGASVARMEEEPVRKRKIAAAAAILGLLLLVVVGWAVVTFAMRLGQFAGQTMSAGRK